MTWVGGVVVILLVTGKAVGGYVGIIIGIVTLVAVHPGMPFGERKTVVVEGGGCPAGPGGMAPGTVNRKVCRYVVWVGGVVVILLVAGIAVGWCVCEITGCMAPAAVLDIVTSGEREKQVAESPSSPAKGGHGMAFGAFHAQVTRYMVGIPGSLVIGHVTVGALNSEGLKAQ